MKLWWYPLHHSALSCGPESINIGNICSQRGGVYMSFVTKRRDFDDDDDEDDFDDDD